MDKNSITGLVLIALLLFGFSFYQNRQDQKRRAYQAQLDSIALADRMRADSIALEEALIKDSLDISQDSASTGIYKDSLLNVAMSSTPELVTLSNEVFEVAFTTMGAQPYSAKMKEYTAYGGDDLYLFKPGMSTYGIELYAGETINTASFNFTVSERTDTSVAMRLPFSGGGYIEQRYAIEEGSYSVKNTLSFIGMENVIPKNVFSYGINYSVTMPRMEKGYKNEVQYSKLDYYFSGEKDVESIGRGRSANKSISTKLSWFDFQQQFFSVILRNPNEFTSADFDLKFASEDDPDHNLMTCTANLTADFQPGQHETVMPMEFYMGPNHYRTLKSYDQKYEKVIPLGGWLVGWFTKYFIIPLFDFLHRFISNFGIIILLMTIVIKIVVLPFSYKSYASSAKMQAIKPEIDKLNKKYPKQEDAMKKQQATMELYKKADVNIMGGCIPALIQMPILIAMFRFFPASIELRGQSFLWSDDLSSYDSILQLPFNIPFYGDHVSLFALLMAVVFFAFSYMNYQQSASSQPQMAGMKFMMVYMMPIMMLLWFNDYSSGLCYYYLLSNLITIIQTVVIRHLIDDNKIHALVHSNMAKNTNGKKSRFQQKYEELMRQQEQMQRQQRKNR